MLLFVFRFFPAFILLLSPSVAPQGATLRGTVTDEHAEPMMGVTVLMKHLPTSTFRGAITRADGSFMLSNLRAGGPYAITLAYTGYTAPGRDSLQLGEGQQQVLNFRMKPTGTR